ncbi:MAG TPA: MrpF/PhaF family protein [Thermohalobaculum sp.]|nr:MrpF/PhaF family protein [Thermohalobaculum sp.]
MHDLIFGALLLWHAALLLLLLVRAARADDLLTRLIGFDAASVVLMSGLIVIAVERREAVYLDIALVLAMLVFVQTVAAGRFLEKRDPSE